MRIDMLSKRGISVSTAAGLAILGSTMALAAPGAEAGHATPNPAVAHAARTVSISETATLRLVGRPGHVLNERGTVSGTYAGTVEARLSTITSTRGEATVVVYTHGGALDARAPTHAHPEGAYAGFFGTAVITGGTGIWAHASGTMSFKGSVDRQNFHSTAEMHGTLHA